MLRKALIATALTMVSGVALAHDYRGHRYYYPPVRHYQPAPRIVYRPVFVAPRPAIVVPAPAIVFRLRFPL